jgi:hypothetical protein
MSTNFTEAPDHENLCSRSRVVSGGQADDEAECPPSPTVLTYLPKNWEIMGGRKTVKYLKIQGGIYASKFGNMRLCLAAEIYS